MSNDVVVAQADLRLRDIPAGTNRPAAVRAILEQLDDWYAGRSTSDDAEPDPESDPNNDGPTERSSGAEPSLSETDSGQDGKTDHIGDSDPQTELGGDTPNEGTTNESDSGGSIETGDPSVEQTSGDGDTSSSGQAQGDKGYSGIFSYALQNVRGDLGR